MRKRLLVIFIAQSLAGATIAAENHSDEHAKALDAVVVKADPRQGTFGDLIQPATVLTGAVLDERKAATLGETLMREPGVHNSYFGPGAGRPIIRGQDGARVQVLSDGTSSMDVSTVSVDHAVTIEPFLADQIEVLRGPTTLLYGPGSVGGVVNVLDGRIAEQAIEDGFSGRAQLGTDTVADSVFGMARIDVGSEGFVLHADAFYRDTEDYDIRGRAEMDADEDEPEGVLENSSQEAKGGAIGASLIGEGGFLGVSISRYDSNYGIPGHGHEEEYSDAFAKGEEDEEEVVRLDLEQTRIDLKGGIDNPFASAESLRVRLSHNDYGHVELEGDEIGTEFDNQELTGRLDIVHGEIGGWRGAYGLTFTQRDFSATGEEAFVPPSDTEQFGLFLLEGKDYGTWRLELGARYDTQAIDIEGASADHSGFSAAVGASFDLMDGLTLNVGVDRAVRLPNSEELFSDGPHIATGSFEIGDADLDEEIANQFEIGLKYRGERFNGSVSAFHARFDDFIFLADTSEEEDELPVREWSQDDARFTGFEAEGVWHLSETDNGHFDLRAFADTVRARIDDGDDLPRIPQSRFGAEVRWHLGPWRASAGPVHYFEQDRTAQFESETDAFTLWNAALSYRIDAQQASFDLYLKGDNLSDEDARLHTSFLKDRAPLPGRNVTAGVRVLF